MEKKILVEYVRRPGATGHVSPEFSNAIMKTFKGRKASTDIERLVKSYINNQKIGILVAVPSLDSNKVRISYAQWNQGLDSYDKDLMVGVALDRLDRFDSKPDTFLPKLPFEIANKLPRFMARCRRYYKDAKFPAWTEKF